MKAKSLLLLITIALLNSINSTANDKTSRSSGFLEVDAIIFSGNTKLKKTTIEVYENGELISTINQKASNFNCILNLGKKYLIKFSKAGYASKSIEFETAVGKSIHKRKPTFSFLFDIELVQIDSSKPFELVEEQPAAEVFYSVNKGNFGHATNIK